MKRKYLPATRKCVYKALECNVPVKKIGGLLSHTITVLTGMELKDVPSPTLCAHMAHELGLLSSIHMVEFMLQSSAMCLSWDATSLDGAHVNEIHVTANDKHMVVDVRHIPGGRASDYVTHIMNSFSAAADCYVKLFPDKWTKQDLLVHLYKRIASTLTDRAAVNHRTRVDLEMAVNAQLEAVEMSLLELNCNVHPLDSIASAARQVLKTVEDTAGIPKGFNARESVALNVIMAVSKLR